MDLFSKLSEWQLSSKSSSSIKEEPFALMCFDLISCRQAQNALCDHFLSTWTKNGRTVLYISFDKPECQLNGVRNLNFFEDANGWSSDQQFSTFADLKKMIDDQVKSIAKKTTVCFDSLNSVIWRYPDCTAELLQYIRGLCQQGHGVFGILLVDAAQLKLKLKFERLARAVVSCSIVNKQVDHYDRITKNDTLQLLPTQVKMHFVLQRFSGGKNTEMLQLILIGDSGSIQKRTEIGIDDIDTVQHTHNVFEKPLSSQEQAARESMILPYMHHMMPMQTEPEKPDDDEEFEESESEEEDDDPDADLDI